MARITCSLVLTGDAFNPSEISRRVGVVPTLSWKEGDAIERTARRRTDRGWKLSVEEPSSLALDVVLQNLVQLLEPHKATLRAIIDQYELEAEFACAIYLDNGVIPSMHFDKRLIGALQAYNAELDIDMYPNLGEEDQGA